MKANEAPEKIYIDVSLDSVWGMTERLYEEEVEYTRTDAIIEKACQYWYQYNRDIVKKHGAKAILGCSEFTVNVEDFKKYMEENKL